MDAADAGRALALGNRIQEIQQILFGIDNGWAITAMTLTAPEPPPPILQEPEILPPPGPPEDEEEGEDQEDPRGPEPDEERPPVEDEEPPPEPEGLSVGEVTVDTVGLTYPPQMLQSIRQQEIQLWREAYDALAGMGVTNAPQPPTEEPAPIPAPTLTSAAAPAPISATSAAPAPATSPAPVVTSRPQTRPFGRRK